VNYISLTNPKLTFMKWFLLALNNYAGFKGRSRRKEYWYFTLFHFLFAIFFAFLSSLLQSEMIYNIYMLALVIPAIAVSIRRMHDINKSGWYILIPIYNLILACTAGTEGENKYGYDPKGDGTTFEFERENLQQ
jgi:uncharacterized membrane protein YhaH (DUF805 family)